MASDNIVYNKSRAFAARIVRLSRFLFEKKEYVLSKQVLRSGTSIGANICESGYAQSRADFIGKLSIVLKEAAETHYWLELLYETDYITRVQYDSIDSDCTEIIKLLTSIIKSGKGSAYFTEL